MYMCIVILCICSDSLINMKRFVFMYLTANFAIFYVGCKYLAIFVAVAYTVSGVILYICAKLLRVHTSVAVDLIMPVRLLL